MRSTLIWQIIWARKQPCVWERWCFARFWITCRFQGTDTYLQMCRIPHLCDTCWVELWQCSVTLEADIIYGCFWYSLKIKPELKNHWQKDSAEFKMMTSDLWSSSGKVKVFSVFSFWWDQMKCWGTKVLMQVVTNKTKCELLLINLLRWIMKREMKSIIGFISEWKHESIFWTCSHWGWIASVLTGPATLWQTGRFWGSQLSIMWILLCFKDWIISRVPDSSDTYLLMGIDSILAQDNRLREWCNGGSKWEERDWDWDWLFVAKNSCWYKVAHEGHSNSILLRC